MKNNSLKSLLVVSMFLPSIVTATSIPATITYTPPIDPVGTYVTTQCKIGATTVGTYTNYWYGPMSVTSLAPAAPDSYLWYDTGGGGLMSYTAIPGYYLWYDAFMGGKIATNGADPGCYVPGVLRVSTGTYSCPNGYILSGTNCLSSPDLTAGAVTPFTATAGTPSIFSAIISNTGAGSTGAGFSNFFQVATAANGGGVITDLTSSTMTTLAAGVNAVSTSPAYTFPVAGTYSVRACADKTSSGNTGVITESDETNNCGVWTTVTVVAPSSCTLPWGGTIASGNSATAYQSSLVTAPTTCASVSESRTCTNGTLSGTYTNQSCAVASSCTLPWGGSIASGASTPAYLFPSVPSPTTCASVSQTRTCTNGVLSGSYANDTCFVVTSCNLPWGGTIASGNSVTAYQTPSVTSPTTCASVSQTRTCASGTLSGTYTNQSCTAGGIKIKYQQF